MDLIMLFIFLTSDRKRSLLITSARKIKWNLKRTYMRLPLNLHSGSCTEKKKKKKKPFTLRSLACKKFLAKETSLPSMELTISIPLSNILKHRGNMPTLVHYNYRDISFSECPCERIFLFLIK
ncbi:hypothetical protein XELAEV_18026544mg [Xenopus laevis]|uniref:Uncharacterized protein n=1 Tax=Xenopus laevis TaxID=8355 RepID=A0A974CTY5_XENLA|nr:hypothetical protein XELAEV_18026544mg [Xenopus laevis]